MPARAARDFFKEFGVSEPENPKNRWPLATLDDIWSSPLALPPIWVFGKKFRKFRSDVELGLARAAHEVGVEVVETRTWAFGCKGTQTRPWGRPGDGAKHTSHVR